MSAGWRARLRRGETRPKPSYCGLGWVGVAVTAGAGVVAVDEAGGIVGGAGTDVGSVGAGVASEGVGEGPAASGLAAGAAVWAACIWR